MPPQAGPKAKAGAINPPPVQPPAGESQMEFSLAAPPVAPTPPAPTVIPGAGQAPKVKVIKRKKSPPFWPSMAKAPLFPLLGKSLMVLIGGTAVFTGMHYFLFFLGKIPFLGDFAKIGVSLILAGLVIGYFLNAIASTAGGEAGAPDWPEWKGVDSALQPLMNLLPFVFIWVMGSVAYRYLPDSVKSIMTNPAFKVGLVAAGSVYLPMAVLFVALADSMEGLNPGPVVRAILAVPLRYGFICLLAFAAGTAYVLIGRRIPFSEGSLRPLGYAIKFAAEVYVLLLMARVIGLLYHTSRKELAWMEELFDQ